MSVWGKLVGGAAGFMVGGPFGAVMGAALGHAADQGGLSRTGAGLLGGLRDAMSAGASPLGPARIAAMFGQRDQLFAIGSVVLSAKLSKCDGPVNRAEIDSFKRQFRVPPEAVRDVGRLFDVARDSPESFEPYARQLGEAFSDNRSMLEDVLWALFAIARADGPPNGRELDVLGRIHRLFGLDRMAWERAQGGAPRFAREEGDDPYAVLGVTRETPDAELRTAWKALVRVNHPDTLAARGVTPEFIARAGDKVARINAAWDRIKRERGL